MAAETTRDGRAWSVTPPDDNDPSWVCARLTLRIGEPTGVVTLRLSTREAAALGRQLLERAGRELGMKVREGLQPLADLADEINRLTGGG